MKILNIIFITVILLLNGCANTKQFIDVDDMLKVNAGSTKNQVLTTIGKPNMVRAGIKLKNGDIHEVWVYDVKRNLIKQVLDFNRVLPPFIFPGIKPKKEFKGNGWSGSNLYGFMFKNDKLYKWGFLGDDWPDFKLEEGDYLVPSNGKKSSSSTIANGGFLSKIPIIGNIF